MDSKKVAVIGSGLIGRSFAMLFASAGYDVMIYDLEPKQTSAAKADIQVQLANLENQGLLRGKLSKEEQFNKISTTESLEHCVKGAFFIQECVPERLDIKRSLWSKIDKMVDAKVIMSSSTSALLPSAVSEGLEHKNRFIVSHPTNPPYYAPATEVIPAKWTDSEVTTRTMGVLKEVGQVPVLIKKEVNGFVLNRLQYAIMGEAYKLVKICFEHNCSRQNDGYFDESNYVRNRSDGVVSANDLDIIMSEGLGMRYAFMGPWETAHLNAEGMLVYEERYSDTILGIQQTFTPPVRMEGDTLRKIHEDMLKRAGPLEDIQARRQWRDRRLVGLAQLKAKLDREDGGQNK